MNTINLAHFCCKVYPRNMAEGSVPKIHLFICTNSPEKEGKCGHLNSEALRREVKDRVSRLSKGQECVRVNSSGCLGQCHRGIAAVLYPSGHWFFNRTDADAAFFTEVIEKELHQLDKKPFQNS